MTIETLQKIVPEMSEAERQVDREIITLEEFILQCKEKRKPQEDEEEKLGSLLKQLHDQIVSMLGIEARLFTQEMLGHVEEISKMNKSIALARYQVWDIREGELSNRLEVWKSRKKYYIEFDAAIRHNLETEKKNDQRIEEANIQERAQRQAEQETYREKQREDAKREKEQRDKVEEKSRGIVDRLKGKKS